MARAGTATNVSNTVWLTVFEAGSGNDGQTPVAVTLRWISGSDGHLVRVTPTHLDLTEQSPTPDSVLLDTNFPEITIEDFSGITKVEVKSNAVSTQNNEIRYAVTIGK
jgi:hypothetical protein